MAKLILSMDGSVLREIALNGGRVSIGRKAHNGVQIDNLAVSGEHAAVSRQGEQFFVEDLNSTNGTLVNGAPVSRQALRDGDVIEIGKYRLKFADEKGVLAHTPPAEDFEKTMIVRSPLRPQPVAPTPPVDPSLQQTTVGLGGLGGDKAEIPPPAVAAKPAAQPVPQPVPQPAPAQPAARGEPLAVVQILSGANAGKELPLTKSITSLGKPGVQVAVIAKRPQGYFLTHVQGPRRPTVNGTELGAQAHALKDHDVIDLAGIKMEFYIK